MRWRNTTSKHTHKEERSSALFARKNCYTTDRCAITNWCTLTRGSTSVGLAARVSRDPAVSGLTWSSTQRTRRSRAISARQGSRDRRCWRRTSWRTRAWEDSSATSASIVSTWKARSSIIYWRIMVCELLWIFSQLLSPGRRKLNVLLLFFDDQRSRYLYVSLLPSSLFFLCFFAPRDIAEDHQLLI